MCGIACIFSYNSVSPRVDSNELINISNNMHSRGPDSQGEWISADQSIGLAHRRLSIIDTSSYGNQPMLDESNGNRIIFNGEIYNFKQLKAELQSNGYSFKSQTDTEVILKLYDFYGQNFVNRLRGMFAFVIWDEANKGIFAARDHFGIKPLYFSDDGKTVRFASQVKALLAGKSIDRAIDPAGHVGFYLWGYVPEPFTMFKNISSLPSGNSIWIDKRGNHKQEEYFNLASNYLQGIELGKTYPVRDCKEKLHHILLDSIKHHMIADVPLGVFLSAGLDSSTIANLAVESGKENLNTLTLGFREYEGSPDDEVILAETFSQQLLTNQHTFRISRDDFSDSVDHILQSMDQPSIDGVNTYFICKAARAVGLKVALSGLGGDEMFGGYSYFSMIPKILRFSKIINCIVNDGKGFRKTTSSLFKRFNYPKLASLVEYGKDYSSAYMLCRASSLPWQIAELLDEDIFLEGWQRLNTFSAIKKSIGYIDKDKIVISALELQWYMKGQLLRDSDWASMAHSLEVRVPFVDIEVFRSVAELHGSGFFPNKYDMATSSINPLPASVLNRKKTGFSIPVYAWLVPEYQTFSGNKQDYKIWQDIIYKSYC